MQHEIDRLTVNGPSDGDHHDSPHQGHHGATQHLTLEEQIVVLQLSKPCSSNTKHDAGPASKRAYFFSLAEQLHRTKLLNEQVLLTSPVATKGD